MEKHKNVLAVLVCTLSTRREGNRQTLSCQTPPIAFTL